MKPKPLALGALGIAALAGIYVISTRSAPDAESAATGPGAPLVSVNVPDLTGKAQIGATAFAAKCAACHGQNAAGSDSNGPPLVHKIYEPSHHGDMAFLLAVRNGVQSHHWRFGNMAPVEGLTDGDVSNIVAYIRALQVANGIQ
jgi:mono/diheme cytochrome c family protein